MKSSNFQLLTKPERNNHRKQGYNILFFELVVSYLFLISSGFLKCTIWIRTKCHIVDTQSENHKYPSKMKEYHSFEILHNATSENTQDIKSRTTYITSTMSNTMNYWLSIKAESISTMRVLVIFIKLAKDFSNYPSLNIQYNVWIIYYVIKVLMACLKSRVVDHFLHIKIGISFLILSSSIEWVYSFKRGCCRIVLCDIIVLKS